MRPRLITAENAVVQSCGRAAIAGFNEAAAHHRGEPFTGDRISLVHLSLQ